MELTLMTTGLHPIATFAGQRRAAVETFLPSPGVGQADGR